MKKLLAAVAVVGLFSPVFAAVGVQAPKPIAAQKNSINAVETIELFKSKIGVNEIKNYSPVAQNCPCRTPEGKCRPGGNC